MMSDEAINQRFTACNCAVKTILEALIGKEVVSPQQVARLLRDQAQECSNEGQVLASTLLIGFADFAEDPTRIAGRRLLNEPPHRNVRRPGSGPRASIYFFLAPLFALRSATI
jgi:hypothetical protein